MRIAIDARGINLYKGTGIGTYTQNIIKKLLSIDASNEYSIFWSGENYKEYEMKNTKIIMTSKKHQRFFEKDYFPHSINKSSIDIYHIPQNGMGMNPEIKCKKICTIHDLIPYIMPETVGKGYLKNFIKKIPEIMEICDGIITVSEYSKQDILKFFPGFPEDRVFVTPLAADSIFTPLDKKKCGEIIKDNYNIDKPFILYLGGFSKRKNVEALIEAFIMALPELNEDYNLVIAGSLKDDGKALFDRVIENNWQRHINFIGFVEEQMLPVLYNSCSTFVYPSLYEGFGLPPLEAMSCGTPVITSRVSSIPEVVKDCGVLIDPYCIEDIAQALIKLLNSKSLLSYLSKRSLERSREFSWERAAKTTLDVYKKICN